MKGGGADQSKRRRVVCQSATGENRVVQRMR